MKSMIVIRLALVVVVALIPTVLIAQSPADDPVYTVDQVDERAKVKNQLEHLPDALDDCPIPVGVSLQVVLRKSGKVTDIHVVKSSGCSYDREAIKAVKKLNSTRQSNPVNRYRSFRTLNTTQRQALADDDGTQQIVGPERGERASHLD